MDIKKYIASGILELYVAGSLSEEENQQVYDAMQEYPEIKKEVEQIEQAILKLSAGVAPKSKKNSFANIKASIDKKPMPLKEDSDKKINWFRYVGWAASITLLFSCLWLFNENKQLKDEIRLTKTKNETLEDQISKANESVAKATELNAILRAQNIESTTLSGQAISPNSYAKVFWNKEAQLAYIDVAGLPAPPPGKVYQVWSLQLNPLTPTSIGILDNFASDENKVFTLTNTNVSQAFGITLEPEGGSDVPTLEQLYALGIVKA